MCVGIGVFFNELPILSKSFSHVASCFKTKFSAGGKQASLEKSHQKESVGPKYKNMCRTNDIRYTNRSKRENSIFKMLG